MFVGVGSTGCESGKRGNAKPGAANLGFALLSQVICLHSWWLEVDGEVSLGARAKLAGSILQALPEQIPEGAVKIPEIFAALQEANFG